MDPLKELLTNAMHEIRDLRRRNEILSAKVEVMDLFAVVLHSTAARRSEGGMAPDVAWALQKKIDEIDATKEHGNAHQGPSGARVDESQSARNGG